MKGFTGKGAKVFESAFGIGTLDAGDPLGIVAAGEEVFDGLADPLQAEAAIGGGIGGVVGLSERGEMLCEDGLEDRGAAGCIGEGRGRGSGGIGAHG